MESLQLHSHNQPALAQVSPARNNASPNSRSTATLSPHEHDDFLCPRHDSSSTSSRQNNPVTADQQIHDLQAHICEIREELAAKSRALGQRESELLEIQSNLELLQENIVSLNEDRVYYKQEYERARDSELKIRRDLEESESTSKQRDLTLQEKLREIGNLKAIISEKNFTIESLKARTGEIDTESKDLGEYRRRIEAYQRELADCQAEVQRLGESLNGRDQMIRRLEEIAKRSGSSGGSSPSEKDQEIFHLQEYLKVGSPLIL